MEVARRMSTSALVGIVGGAIGVASFAFTVVAWWIERRDRRRELQDERAARKEQLELERKRLEADLTDREARRHAEITSSQGGFHPEGETRVYDFTLKNLGPSWAKHVTAWLITKDGERVSDRPIGMPLEPGESRDISVPVRRKELWEEPVEVRLQVMWQDISGGPYYELSNLEVRLQ
jgi:hypothetical protein